MADEIENKQTLGVTAHWTAAVRARESTRADRLFNDPWADALAGASGRSWITQRVPESVLPIIIRTRFFDDFLRRITTEHAIRQLVLMAAGLDTRAYRLDWPEGTRLFELDQAPVLAYKEQVLRDQNARPTCRRETVTADLTTPWEAALAASGFDPQQPAVWLLEGFLFYLSTQHLTHLLEHLLHLAAPGSRIGFDMINPAMLTSPYTRAWVEMQARSGAPWTGTMDDPEAFLNARGWTAALTSLGDPDANFGRWSFPPLPPKQPDVPHFWLVTGRKH